MIAQRFILLNLLLFTALPLFPAPSDDTSHFQISLLTTSPGTELYSMFGHSAILVSDTVRGTDDVYNYGTFEFNQPDFYGQFVRGELDYFLSVACFSCVQHTTRLEKRSLIKTPLRLSTQETNAIIRSLEQNALPQNRYYRYDFQYDNCSNRILDVILKHTNHPVGIDPDHIPKGTFRHMLDPYLKSRPWIHAGIDLVLGSRVDRKASWQESAFLPDNLHALIAHAKTVQDGKKEKLSQPDQHMVSAGTDPAYRWISPGLIFGIVTLLIIASLFAGSWYRKVMYFLGQTLISFFFLLSLFLIFLWVVPQHNTCAWNTDLLWANPLLLPVMLLQKRRNNKYVRWLLRACFALCLCGMLTTLLIEQNIHLTAAAAAASAHLLTLLLRKAK